MAYSFPYRVYTFKKKAWHYFLFGLPSSLYLCRLPTNLIPDLCYYVNLLNLVFIWFMPHSKFLFQSCYLLSHGNGMWVLLSAHAQGSSDRADR
jgi:hypothetical protein